MSDLTNIGQADDLNATADALSQITVVGDWY
jgi:hypothetical protein